MTDRFGGFQNLLRAVFPDPRSAITEQLVTATLSALPAELQTSLVGEVLEAAAGIDHGSFIGAASEKHVLGYYEVAATHERHGVHEFVGRVPFVRVRVPEAQSDIATSIGIVYAGDHKLFTMKQVRDELQDSLDFRIGSAEWLTPARYFGARFAAVATLALRDEEDGAIKAYVLEAGMATGEAMVRYLAPDLENPIVRRSWYEPTPFSQDDHLYTGFHSFVADEPYLLTVRVRKHRAVPHHLTVLAEYERVTEPKPVWPSLLTAQAAQRVALIAKRLGKPVPGVPDWMVDILAESAKALDWKEMP